MSENVIAALNVPTSEICLLWEYCLALAETAVRIGAEIKLNHEVTGICRADGDHLPYSVKTDGAIPKGMIFDVMDALKEITPTAPVRIRDIVIKRRLRHERERDRDTENKESMI